MAPREKVHKLLDQLDDRDVHVVERFVEFLVHGGQGLTDEDKEWLDADLSRATEIEPYDWGGTDPLAGERVRWDAGRGAFVVEEAS